MKSFKEHLTEVEYLTEVAIQFGGKAYPKFGQVVILAGGAGSGKGFIKDKLLSIDGKVFDVDKMKSLAIASSVFSSKVRAETGVDLKSLDLHKPENVSKIHEILGGLYKVDKKIMSTVNRSVISADPNRKPNLIFDVTLKDIPKLQKISKAMQEIGYKKEDIHIVWVMNDFKVAVEQNANRDRIVSDEILFATHEGAALTFKKIIDMGDKVKKYMDGDIVVAFNRVGIDTDFKASKRGGSYIKRADYIRLKRKGGSTVPMDKIGKDVINKIQKYVPHTVTWN